jgi:hypothetical protein
MKTPNVHPTNKPARRAVRRMWADPDAFVGPYAFTLFYKGSRPKPFTHPVAVVSLLEQDMEALVERVARSVASSYGSKWEDLTKYGRNKHYPRIAGAVVREIFGKA